MATTNFRRRRGGNAVVMSVFTMTLLLIVGMGTTEFGQYLYIKHAFQSAARDAARQAAVESATAASVYATAQRVLLQANVTLDPSWYNVYSIPAAGGSPTAVGDPTLVHSGDRVQIAIVTTYGAVPNACRPLYSIFGVGIGPAKPISGISTAVRE